MVVLYGCQMPRHDLPLVTERRTSRFPRRHRLTASDQNLDSHQQLIAGSLQQHERSHISVHLLVSATSYAWLYYPLAPFHYIESLTNKESPLLKSKQISIARPYLPLVDNLA